MQNILKMPFVNVNRMVKNKNNNEKPLDKCIHIIHKDQALISSSHSNASMYILYMNGGLFKKKAI